MAGAHSGSSGKESISISSIHYRFAVLVTKMCGFSFFWARQSKRMNFSYRENQE